MALNGEDVTRGAEAIPPFTGENPCPDCKWGTCHRCGEDKPDAIPAPHMGVVVLCGPCFMEHLR